MKKIPTLRAIQVRMTPIVVEVLTEVKNYSSPLEGEEWSNYSRRLPLASSRRTLKTQLLILTRQTLAAPVLVILSPTAGMKEKIEVVRREGDHQRKRRLFDKH